MAKVSILNFEIIYYSISNSIKKNKNKSVNQHFENKFIQLRLFNIKPIAELKYCHTFAVYYFTNTLNVY